MVQGGCRESFVIRVIASIIAVYAMAIRGEMQSCICLSLATPLIGGDYITQQQIDYCWNITMFEWYGLQTEWSFRFQWEDTNDPWCQADQCSWDNRQLMTLLSP